VKSIHSWIPILVLGVVVLLGTLVRLDNLVAPSIGHGEIFVPGINLPHNLAKPPPRLNLYQTVRGTLAEPHPPAYYILMLGWTKLFGTGVLALRLPSVLFGVLSLLLIYMLCALEEEDKLTGLLASGMLALNGLHIFWSQTARLYSMGTFLSLLSTALLLLMFRRTPHQWMLQLLYFASTLTGLATVLFFWPLFATHMLWTLGTSLTEKRATPGLLRLQLLIFILASPLLALAAFQSKRSSYFSEDISPSLYQFMQFGFLFEPHLHSVSTNSIPPGASSAVFLIALFLILIGLLSANRGHETESTITAGPARTVIVLTGILACLCILVFAKFAHELNPRRTNWVVASASIPILLLLSDFLLVRYWGHIQALAASVSKGAIQSTCLPSLNSLLATIPVTMVVGLSLAVPTFASRTVLLYIPYLLIVLSRGLARLIHRNRLWIILVLGLGVIHSFSVIHYKNRLHSPAAYKTLAEKWIPKIENTDLIFLERHWTTTPVFYYLKGDRYRFVGENYSERLRKAPLSRVWVLSIPARPNDEAMNALRQFTPSLSIEARGIKAELYVRKEKDLP